MKMLAHGTAKFITSVYCSDLVTVKPLAFIMFGSQAPRPMATPKNAVKQIMPAMTRLGNMPEHDAERIALGVAGGIRRQRARSAASNLEPLEHVERFLAAAVGGEIARRFRQREAEHPDDQRAGADQDPYATPDILGDRGSPDAAGQQHQRGTDRPHAGAADEVHDRENAAADRFRRIFTRIGEASGCSAPRPSPAMKRQMTSSVTLGASAPRMVNTPNSSRLN